MAKIVSIFTNDISSKYIDAWLIPIKKLSCRSFFEVDLNKAIEIRKKSNKEIYFLCDKLISESETNEFKQLIINCLENCDLLFFQDFYIYNLAKEYNLLSKLVYYSPTLCTSYQEVSILKRLGINNFILSKESTYDDYVENLNNHHDIGLGMLCFGYPQIYYSKRKMITSFETQYKLTINRDVLKIKEKTRDFYQSIIEDENGTYIFAGEIFFPYQYLSEFKSLGMEMFLIDPSFVTIKNIDELVNNALNGNLEEIDFASTYLMFKEMVNDYGK